MKFHTIYIFGSGAIMMTTMLASCASEGDEPRPDGHGAEIAPTAELYLTQEYNSRVLAVEGSAFGANHSIGVLAYKSTSYSSVNFDDTHAVIKNLSPNKQGSTSTYKFSPAKYYPLDQQYTHFYAYYPYSSSFTITNNVPYVEFDFDKIGCQDIMWASHTYVENKIEGQVQPSLGFEHLMCQVRFKFVKAAGMTSDVKITEVKNKYVSGQTSNIYPYYKLNLIAGTISSSKDGNAVYKVTPTSGSYWLAQTSSSASEISESMMLAPISGQYKLKFVVTVDGKESETGYVTLPTMTKGQSVLVTFNISPVELTFSVGGLDTWVSSNTYSATGT